MINLWEDKYIHSVFDQQTLNGVVSYHKDKWGAVLYTENKLQSDEPQRIYDNEEEYIKSIYHLLSRNSFVKKQLNDAIKWTSSKFNYLRKSEVIDEIIDMQPDEEKEFECGAYSEKSWCGGYHYKVYKGVYRIIIINLNRKETTTINLLNCIKNLGAAQ